MIIGPALYDLRRGILRVSVMIVLALFIISGVGLTYLVHSMLTTNPLPIVNRIIIYEADLNDGTLYIEGVVYTRPYEPLNGELEFNLACFNMSRFHEVMKSGEGKVISEDELSKFIKEEGVEVAQGRFSFNGEFKYSVKIDKVSIPRDYMCRFKYTLITAFLIANYYRYSEILLTKDDKLIIYGYDASSLLDLRLTIFSSTTQEPYTSITQGFLIISSVYKEREIYKVIGAAIIPSMKGLPLDIYIQPASFPMTVEFNPSEVEEKYIKIGSVNQGLFKVEVNPGIIGKGEYGYDIVVIASTNETIIYGMDRASPYIFDNLDRVGTREIALIQLLTGSLGTGIFQVFFPVVMLYLAYVYIAKPRSQGALEFILARPITRFNLYLTRFIAGVLVALVASAVFHVSLMLSIWYVFRVSFDYVVYSLLYLGTALSLIAFYSLCYFFSSITRGARYLALSIFIYLFFTVIINILQSVIMIITIRTAPVENIRKLSTDIQYILSYFNPLGISTFTNYYIVKYIGVDITELTPSESVVFPAFVALSIAAWITIPLILGWLIFKKANLQG
ncbi:MAG: ABC transporter permease subunit [Desulfurococcaceae archaeon]